MASTWAATANNETISFNNLQNGVDTGVLSQKAAIPVSNEQITKTDANTYVNIDTSFAPYAAKTSNQLVVKSNLLSVVTVNTIANTSLFSGIANNQTTSSPIQLIAGANSSNDGRIFRSTDFGVNYSSVLTINNVLLAVKFMPTFRHASYLSVPPFLSVGLSGRIVTNSVTDCSSWITISSPTTQNLTAIAFNSSGVGIIVGTSRILKTNTNFRINAWSIVNSNSPSWRGAASDGSRFIAVGLNSSILAGDSLGTTWSVGNMPPLSASTISLLGATYHSDSFFYAVGHTASNTPYIMRSSDSGFNWEIFNTTGDSFTGRLYAIESFNGKLYVGGDGNQYEIANGVVRRFSTTNYTWVSVVKDGNSNGFDMAGSGPSGLGAYSNF
jgi:hypothetical protein